MAGVNQIRVYKVTLEVGVSVKQLHRKLDVPVTLVLAVVDDHQPPLTVSVGVQTHGIQQLVVVRDEMLRCLHTAALRMK